jgi:hypothetical protein
MADMERCVTLLATYLYTYEKRQPNTVILITVLGCLFFCLFFKKLHT